MLVQAEFEKCILCLERPADSREHPLPECIGGTLEAFVLCTPCNCNSGSNFVSQLKKDPTIRTAVQALRGRIPEFASQFEEGLLFHAEGAAGIAVEVSRKGDTWKTKARDRNADGLIMDTGDVPKYIRNTLRKQGFSGPEAESWVDRLAACENGEELRLPSGDIQIKNKATVQLPKFTEGFLDDRFPALIAFEFLALCVGKLIFDPVFDAVRKYICFGTATEQVHVVPKRAHEFEPAHVVRFEVEEGGLTVFIEFFRYYVFEVTFRGIPTPPKEIVYLQDLENKLGLMALSREDASQGNWVVV
jgi:hypothetical protein